MNTIKNTARKTNCAQKVNAPKNEKLIVTLLRKVVTTVGVQTCLEPSPEESSEQGLTSSGCLEQSG